MADKTKVSTIPAPTLTLELTAEPAPTAQSIEAVISSPKN